MTKSLLIVFPFLSFMSTCIGAVTAPTFADRYDYGNCFNEPANVASADVNGDGTPDLACGGPGGLVTLLGNGDGTFRTGPTSTLGFAGAAAPVLLDLNGDGKIDVIVRTSPTVTGPLGFGVSFGNGDGTFGPGTFYQTGSDTFGNFIVAGDFNGDGIVDFASEAESGIWLFIGKGGGIFDAGVVVPLNGRVYETDPLAAVDLNGDGKLDIIATENYGFSILLGNGDGTFRPPIDVTPPFKMVGFATGDLNGDGHLDLFAVGSEYNSGLLYLGNGNGKFTLTRQVYTASEPVSVAVADLNGDGFLDIITSGSDVLFGNGKGYFSAPVYYPIASNGDAYYVLPADLRNNGRIDLVFVNFFPGISVLLNAGKSFYQDGEKAPVAGGGAYCAVSADFNGDGKPDVAIGVDQGMEILLGTGKALSPYTEGQLISLAPFSCPATGDLNGDGIPDLLTTSSNGTAIAYLGNGDGTFTQVAKTTLLTANGTVVLGDFNGDGKLDFALTSNLLALGNGDGTFQTPAPYIPQVMGTSIAGIAAARLNGDRATDIVLTDVFANIVYVLLSNGKGGFTQTTFNPSAHQCAGPGSVALADVNGDGKKDIVVGCAGPNVPIYLNNGEGGFQYSITLNYGNVADAAFPAVADLNGDGIADIVVQGNSNLAIFTGQGSMTFSAPLYIGSGTEPGHVLAVDAHGQRALAGKPDLITPDATGVMNVYLNTTK